MNEQQLREIEQQMRESMYYVKPTGMAEAHGHLWPDGAPLLCPPEHELRIAHYWEEDGTGFSLAYTRDQVDEYGDVFAPYIPLSVGRLLGLSPRPGLGSAPVV